MKPGVVILNYARDLLVDEKAVLKAIEEGKIKHYVTDFPNTTVVGKKGVILTPHLGASTEEAEDNCAVMAAKEIKDNIENGNIKNSVNYAVMACHELMDYIENGNITNSVNYPHVDAGKCNDRARITICHKNVPNVVAQFTTILGASNINISNMVNKSRGEYAYTVLDVSNDTDAVLKSLEAIDDVLKVRLIK